MLNKHDQKLNRSFKKGAKHKLVPSFLNVYQFTRSTNDNNIIHCCYNL